MRARRPTKRIRMLRGHDGLKKGAILLRPHHVAEAYIRAGLAEIAPSDAQAPDVAPPPGPGAGASTSEDEPKPKPKRKYTRRKKAKGD